MFFCSPRVPLNRQLMASLKRNHFSMILICSLQPILQMCFRTESEDGSSGETNFFPELSCRNNKMHKPFGSNWLVFTNQQIQMIITLSTPARSVTFGIFAQDGSNTEDIPNSIAVIFFPVYFGRVVGRQSRKWMSHPDRVATRSQCNIMCSRKPLESAFYFIDRQLKSFCSFFCRRWSQCTYEGLIYEVPHLSIKRRFFSHGSTPKFSGYVFPDLKRTF